jgi:hypothetical protein
VLWRSNRNAFWATLQVGSPAALKGGCKATSIFFFGFHPVVRERGRAVAAVEQKRVQGALQVGSAAAAMRHIQKMAVQLVQSPVLAIALFGACHLTGCAVGLEQERLQFNSGQHCR